MTNIVASGDDMHSPGDVRIEGVSAVGILILSEIEMAPVTFLLCMYCAAGCVALAKLKRSIEKFLLF